MHQKLHSLIAVQPNAPGANLNGRPVWGQRGEGAAINTAINRCHKSLALLPALCIDIVVAALSAPGLNPSHDESGKHRQRGDVRKERKATYGSE